MGNVKPKNAGWTELERLGFLVKFMNELNISTTDVADKLGISRQSVSKWMQNDDCMISRIYQIAESYGYELKMSFESDYEKKGKSWVKIENVINYGRFLGDDYKPCRLTPLNVQLLKNGITKTKLAKDLGLSFANVSRWFKESIDDTSMKHIYEIAELYHWDINFEFKQKSENDVRS